MAMNAAYLNAIADHGASVITHVSLADGALETDEIVGMVRQAITWNAAVDGDIDSSNEPALDVPGGNTVTHVQFWSALTAGVWYGSSAVQSETFNGDGVYTINDADINHNAVT